ncbi:MAG: M20 family metallo-hydrolase [Treponema sp.]|jgi:succinyl-diaminopimelate desuccinylase|nr:M20 family metallo-hydrolase [Treponema sp.]
MMRNIFDFIENSTALAVELETELCKLPAISPDSGGQGEIDKAEFLEKWLKERGIANIERFDAPDKKAKGGVRPNIIATIHGKSEKRLWIISHLDVVPPGERRLWNSDPWTLVEKDGRLIGRGVEDNQQGLVSSCLAALAFVKNNVEPDLTVKLLFAADEEMGSRFGVLWLVKNKPDLLHADDVALIPDGGDSKGQGIEIAEKNLLWLKFTASGVQAHGSRPDQGVNAHLAGAYLLTSLYERLSAKFNTRDSLFEPDYSTFQPTKKEANVPNVNTIPGTDVFYMDMRILPQYPLKAVFDEINVVKAEIETRFGVKIVYETCQQSESKATAADAPFVKRLSAAVKEIYGVDTKPIGIGGGTVAAPLRNMGIDAAVWARLDDTAHQPNEYTLVSNIIGDAKVIARLMRSA